MTKDPRIEVQRRVHALFTQKFASGEPITKEEVQAITQWKPKTLNTYWSKQFRSILAQRPDGRYRVTESFRNYSDFKRFRELVTQVKVSDPSKPPAAPDYTLLQHDHVLIYEFFMPLTNETTLKQSLDRLFYRDAVLSRLRQLDQKALQRWFPPEGDRADHYYEELCDWISDRFSGYSIAVVNGRFRIQDLVSRVVAANSEAGGKPYLIDETTAIVRFIFPCGKPIRREPPEAVTDYDDPEEAPEDQKALDEASSIRWFFKALFVQNILEVVAGKEAEVWMVESGIRNRVHIYRVDREPEEEDEEQDDLFTEE
jgi:hypothetical protein